MLPANPPARQRRGRAGVETRSRLRHVPGTTRFGPLAPAEPLLGRGTGSGRHAAPGAYGSAARGPGRPGHRGSRPGLPRGPRRPPATRARRCPGPRGASASAPARPGPSGARSPAPTARRRGHGVGLGLHPPAWAAFPRPFPRAAPAPGGRPPPGAEPGPSSSSRCPAPGPECPAAEAAAVLTQTASWECCSPLGPAREKKNVFQAPSPSSGPDSSIYSP